jgi:hypothetical protein
MTEFKGLIRKIVYKLFLVIWSPWGEEKESDIDISFGFVFKNEPNELCIISVDKDELWSPHILFESLPENKYSWEDFYPRIEMWMNAEDENLILGKEYFDVTKSEIFDSIIGKEIEGIELIKLESNPEPFGLKILFKDDYIVSIPNSDGNTVETKAFNKTNSIQNFKHLGKIIYSKVLVD